MSQSAVIEGIIIPNNNSDIEKLSSISLYYNSKTPKLQTVLIETDLSFKFEYIETDTISLSIPGNREDYIFPSFYLSENDTIRLKLPYSYYCEYDISKNDKTCPICKKKNKVIPVEFGLFINDPKKAYNMGCLITDCEPNWYCKRDKITF
ncbi:MAG TPA: hypothetical protein DCS66_08155 [Flavobacteriaceae bacterium]|nr:hypothetical protein [Flavobacteriaceae bacterium]HAT64562.1 hypothetical protein [Flavobacteriaceae bacterium]|tara:strand:- start:64 stop:513 length:450 start_codon:yes stop_codon:yes gene_type:complete